MNQVWEFKTRYSKIKNLNNLISDKFQNNFEFFCSNKTQSNCKIPFFPKKPLFNFTQNHQIILKKLGEYLNNLISNKKVIENIETSAILINYLQIEIWKVKNIQLEEEFLKSLNLIKIKNVINYFSEFLLLLFHFNKKKLYNLIILKIKIGFKSKYYIL